MKRGRTKKVRFIQEMPKIEQFSPRGKPGRPDEIELKIDHFEAIKLSDFQGYDQTEGANFMGISRPSFGRILREGRKILADALVNGKIIKIRTSDVQVGVKKREIEIATNTATNQFNSIRNAAEEDKLRKNIIKFNSK